MIEGFGGGSMMEPLVFAAILAVLLIVATIETRRQRCRTTRVPARLESIRRVATLATEAAQHAGLGNDAAFHCHVALDEACVNIMKHAYGDIEGGEIDVQICVSDGKCVITLIDYGHTYDPDTVPPPRIGESLDDAQPGGLGLYLMRSFMDEIHYTSLPEGNRLVMIKRRQSRNS